MHRDTILVIVAVLLLVIAVVVGSSFIDRNRTEIQIDRLEACFVYEIAELCDYPPTPLPIPTVDTDIGIGNPFFLPDPPPLE